MTRRQSYVSVFCRLAAVIGAGMNIYQERMYQRMGNLTSLAVEAVSHLSFNNTVAKRGPEARLYMACLGGLLLPVCSAVLSLHSQLTTLSRRESLYSPSRKGGGIGLGRCAAWSSCQSALHMIA